MKLTKQEIMREWAAQSWPHPLDTRDCDVIDFARAIEAAVLAAHPPAAPICYLLDDIELKRVKRGETAMVFVSGKHALYLAAHLSAAPDSIHALQRFDLSNEDIDSGDMVPCPDGEYVCYDDVTELLAAHPPAQDSQTFKCAMCAILAPAQDTQDAKGAV